MHKNLVTVILIYPRKATNPSRTLAYFVGISINKISLTFEGVGYNIFLGWMSTGPNTREEVEKHWGVRT